jgi:hypothetical protein
MSMGRENCVLVPLFPDAGESLYLGSALMEESRGTHLHRLHIRFSAVDSPF